MRISTVVLTNIRCYERTALEFSPSINVLVGANNSGKSTWLRALLELQRDNFDQLAIRDGSEDGEITITLENPDAIRLKIPQVPADRAASVRVVLYRNGSKAKHLHYVSPQSGQEERAVLSGIDNLQPANFFYTYLSGRHSVQNSNMGLQYANSVVGGLEHINAKVDRLNSTGPLRAKFQQACAEILGIVIEAFPVEGGKVAGVSLDELGSRHINLTNMGSGVAMAVGLIEALLLGREQAYVIEEPETDLHPKAIKGLLRLMERSATEHKCQFFVSTHSAIVLRHLGGLEGAKVFNVSRMEQTLPTSRVVEVGNTADARRLVLAELGYELCDSELYDAWLLLEESSAERIIREFLIPWFVPRLNGRVRTVAANGVNDLEPRFESFHRLFVFLHLEKAYALHAWVVADGDNPGKEAIAVLRKKFPDWPTENFVNFLNEDFEHYYPKHFAKEIAAALNVDRKERQPAKGALRDSVVKWLHEDVKRGKAALAESALEVLELLRKIELTIVGTPRTSADSSQPGTNNLHECS